MAKATKPKDTVKQPAKEHAAKRPAKRSRKAAPPSEAAEAMAEFQIDALAAALQRARDL